MNLDNQTLLHINAGTLPPADLVKRLVAIQPTAFGYAVQNIFEGKPDLAITREDGQNLNEADLNSFFENSKAFPRTVYFGKLAKGYDTEDIQPFVLHDGNNDPFIALFLEGTLTGHDDPKEHTEQYNLVNGVLVPKLLEWCNDFDGDLEKIMSKIKGGIFKNDFMSHVGHRAVLHILPVEGDSVVIGQNELGAQGDWGWITQRHGFGEEVKQEPVAEKPKNRFGFGGSKTASVPASPVKDAATPGTHDRSNAVGSRPAQKQAPEMAARPPSWCHRNEDVKLWYKIVHGESVSAWKKRIPVTVVDFEAVKIDNLQSFKDYALRKGLETTGGETSAGKVPAETAAHDVKNLSEKVADLPILDAKKLNEVLDFVATLDTSSKEILPPKEIQEMETSLTKFSTAVGLDKMETINWPVHALANLGKKDIMALVCYAVEWRSAYRALKQGQPEVKETETSKTVTTQTGGTTKQESVSKEQSVTPKKRFGFGKAA